MAVARPPPRRQPPPRPAPSRGALTVALGPHEQGHALQPLHVAGRHMPGASVVPLPVLVERVNLHPPPGVGHRAARGPGPRPRRSRPGRGPRGGGSRGRRTPARRGLPGFTGAAGPAPPPAWPAPGPPPLLAARASALLSGPGEPGRPERGAQRSAAFCLAALGTQGAGHCPGSGLRHDLREAASRAATASSGRRRHVFLPYTWPCHRRRWLR